MSAKCPKCRRKFNETGEKSRHHVLPRRWFKGQKTPEILLICRRPCHNMLEKVIKAAEDGRQLRWFDYYLLVNKFLGYPLYELEAGYEETDNRYGYRRWGSVPRSDRPKRED